jgi:thioesterase domain-containing protein
MSEDRTVAEIEAYLHRHIPITRGMGVHVVECSPKGVTLTAPLAPNVNHRSTVFGGSASALVILSAWCWLHFALREAGLKCQVVIQRSTVDYLVPIDGDFSAHCEALAAAPWEKFLRTLRRHGKARIELTARLHLHGKAVSKFHGDYVAVISK